MGEIVNLRTMKKQRARAVAATDAKENRIRHGRTKAEKANDARAQARCLTRLDDLRRREPGE
jgi:Domain of unknown function (DUF4169)